MKKIIISTFFLGLSFVVFAQGNNMFFCEVLASEIDSLSIAGLNYDTIVVDYHFPDAAKIYIPNYPASVIQDSLSQYSLCVIGNVKFRQMSKGLFKVTTQDTISIKSLLILKGKEKSYIRAADPTAICPLPIKESFLDSIKADFLKRMRMCRFSFNRDFIHSVTVGWVYRIGLREIKEDK